MSELPNRPPADHSVKIAHLVFGLLFLGVAAVWALVINDVITEDRLTVIAPAVLIGAGVIGLAASIASTRNRRRPHRGPDTAPLENPAPANHEPENPEPENPEPVNHEPDEHTQEIR